jgi:hypothetical protein
MMHSSNAAIAIAIIIAHRAHQVNGSAISHGPWAAHGQHTALALALATPHTTHHHRHVVNSMWNAVGT